MELPHVGKNCDVSTCNMLDFLPFKCDRCGGTFCSQHKSNNDHQCIQIEERAATEYTGEKSYPCAIRGCSKRELTQISCHHCDGYFCLNHRLQEDHNCPKLPEKRPEVSKTAQHVQELLSQKEFKTKPRLTNPKSIQTAAKVNLMKLKGRAQGDAGIPQSERLYFKVALPLESGKQPVEIFFSKMWSVGRVIDVIADRSSVANNNNTFSEKKLRLFHADTGGILPTDSSLNSIMEDASSLLLNGSCLILERVTEDILVLDAVEKYKK